MSMVINLNILNVYGFKGDSKTVTHGRLKPVTLGKKEIAHHADRTIDVTPSRKTASHNTPALDIGGKPPVINSEHPDVLTCFPQNNNMYRANGYKTKCTLPKGMYVDSYA